MQWCLVINLIGFCVGGLFALALFKSHNLDQVRALGIGIGIGL